MPEPFSIGAVAKSLGDGLAAIWARSAILLWAAAAAGAAVLVALVALSRLQVVGAAGMLATYGLFLALGVVILVVFAGFKTYAERPARTLSFIPNEGQSFWGQSRQPDGQVITSFDLRFQASNLSDGAVLLSAARLYRPWVRRRSITGKMLATEHHAGSTYDSEFPILPHDVTRAMAHISVDHAIGRPGKGMRVVVGLQDHAGRWHKLVYPHLRAFPTPPQPGERR